MPAEIIKMIPPLPNIHARFGDIRQIAYVVDDLTAAMQQWQSAGVSHFMVTQNASPLANARYRGEKIGKIRVDLAFAYIGDLQLELIEQKNELTRVYTESRHQRPGKPHHYGVCVTDFNGVYRESLSMNFSPILDSGFAGIAQMSYLECSSDSELIIELIEWNELTQPYFDQIKRMWRAANPDQLEHHFNLQKLTPLRALLKKIARLLITKLIRS